MRAALRVLCLQCVLLAGTALAAGVALPAPPPGARGSSPAAQPPGSSSANPPAAELAPTAAAAGLPSPPGTAASAAQPLPPQYLLFACPTSLDFIGRVVAAVTVDGRGPFRFIVDTGANYSTISPQLVALLGLQPSVAQAIRVTGITGSAEVASVPIEMLKAGDVEIAHTRFPVIWSSVMAGAAGILGAAGLAQDRLMVDFRHDRVEITRSSSGSFPFGFTRVSANRLAGGLLSIPGTVGGIPVHAIIDTGSQRTLGNLALFRELYQHERGKEKSIAANVIGATRQVGAGKLQLAPMIDLGAIKIGGVALVFGDFHIFKTWGLTSRPTMILGMDVLGTVDAFAIDFRYGEFAVKTRYAAASAVAKPAACRLSLRLRPSRCSG